MTDTDARVPPHDLDAEAAVLSCIMLSDADGMLARRLQDFLKPEHFYSESHRRIFEAACAVANLNGTAAIDIVAIASRLKQTDRLAQVGGMAYLAEIIDAAPSVGRASVDGYAATVFEAWRVRQTIANAQRIAAQGYLGIDGVQGYLDGAVESLASVARRSLTSPIERNLDALKRIVRELGERASGLGRKTTGIPTGIASLDEMTGGLHATHVFTLAGLPGDGKTTMAMQIAVNVARQGIGVLFFSTEQPRDELLVKALSHIGCVNSDRFKDARFTPADWERLLGSATELARLPLWIDETQALDAMTLRQRAVERADKALSVDGVPLGLIVVDYIQNLAAPVGQFNAKKNEVVADAAKVIKAMARLLKIPVVSLAQRKPIDVKGPKNPRPVLYDCADSSGIVKATDEIAYLWNKIGDKTTRTLTMPKQRSGAAGGDIQLRFEGEFSLFVDERREPVRDNVDRGAA